MSETQITTDDCESAAIAALTEICETRFVLLSKEERERVLNYLQWRYVRDYVDITDDEVEELK